MKCPYCFGRGVEIVEHPVFGDQVTPCPDCDGTGDLPDAGDEDNAASGKEN